VAVAWMDERAVVLTDEPGFAAYDPESDCWRTLAAPPTGLTGPVRLFWTGRELLAAGMPPGVASWNPATEVWTMAPLSPLGRSTDVPVLAGDQLVYLSYGSRVEGQVVDGAFDGPSAAWKVIDTPCRVSTDYAVWTGRVVTDGFHDAFDPVTGTCYRLPRTRDRSRTGELRSWTGQDFVIWSGGGGEEVPAKPDGIAFRPTTP